MTKTIKRSLIVVLMLVFAVTAAFTATFTVKADETPDPAVVAADQFKSIVDAWEIEDLTSIDILADIDSATAGDQWLIDSAAKAREMYADGKTVIDSVDTYADAKEKYDAVMVACDDALDFQAEINELVEALKVTSKVVIFGSEELHVNTLENTYNSVLDADEKTYIDSKFVNETVQEVIDAVQAKIADIHAKGAEAEIAIAAIKTFDGEALYGSKATLNAAIAKLTAIYGKTIEEVFAMDVRVAGDVYKEDATKVVQYVSNIATYVELKAEYDAQVAIAQEVVNTINELTATVANTDAAYKFLANEDAINALVEDYEALDSSVENNLKAYVDEAVKYLADDKDNEDPADDVYGSKYQDLLDGIYDDEIQELVDLVLALPEVENDILGLKDALDNYRAKFDDVLPAQKEAVNTEEAPAPYNTIKNMYEYYNELSTQPWAMVQYAINAIDAIILDNGVFVMSVDAVVSLENAQKKYDNVPEDYKKYVTNRDVLFAAQEQMNEDLETVRVWAEMVYAIYENAPISVTNWMAVQDVYDYFYGDVENEEFNIIPQIQDYILNAPDFRAFTLTDVEGVEEDKAIQYYYDLFFSEIHTTEFLKAELDIIAEKMDDAALKIINADENEDTYAEIEKALVSLSEAKKTFNKNEVLSEEDWAYLVSWWYGDPETSIYIPFSYGQAERDFLATEFGAIIKDKYDRTEDDPTTDNFDEKEYYNFYNFYQNYLDAIEIAKRYEVELAIEALTAAEDVTILDEAAIIDTLEMYNGLVAENEEVACGQDSVRNADKLFACKEALDVITAKLDKFVADVNSLLEESIIDTAINLDLVAYAEIQAVRASLTADEATDIGYGPRYGIDVAKAIVNLDIVRKAAINNINYLTDSLNAVTGEKDEFIELYEKYMDLDASQRDKANEAILDTPITADPAEVTASIEDLVDAYIYAGTVANTDWLYSVAGKVEELQDELESKVEELQDALAQKAEELQAKIDELTAKAATKEELEAAIAELEAAIDAIEADIDAIEANIDTIEANIEAIEAEIDETVEAFEESIEVIEGKIAALKTELEGKINTLKTDLEGKISALKTDLEDAIADLEAELKALIKAEADAREEADAELQKQIDSTRTLAIVGLVIAIVALCAAAFVIVYKVILKK